MKKGDFLILVAIVVTIFFILGNCQGCALGEEKLPPTCTPRPHIRVSPVPTKPIPGFYANSPKKCLGGTPIKWEVGPFENVTNEQLLAVIASTGHTYWPDDIEIYRTHPDFQGEGELERRMGQMREFFIRQILGSKCNRVWDIRPENIHEHGYFFWPESICWDCN